MGRHSAVASWLVVIATSIVAGRANAAKLVVMAVNSGADITAPYANLPPLLTPGAKGFLLGVDTEDSEVLALGVQDIHITGSGLINRLVQSPDEGLLSHYPRIITRSQAAPFGNEDQIDYRRDDTYLMNQTQTTPQGDRVWTPVGHGIAEGPGFFDITASFGIPSTSVGGVRPLVYVVTTSDLSLSGFIARDQQGFGLAGGNVLETATLTFSDGSLVGHPYEPPPLPSSGWANPAGGNFQLNSNWVSGHAPTTTELASFGLDQQYSVLFTSDVITAAAEIKKGNVTFDLNGRTYFLASADGLMVANDPLHAAALTVSQGTISAQQVRIGSQLGATAQITLFSGGKLVVNTGAAIVRVGDGGNAVLQVNAGSEVTTGDLMVSSQGAVYLNGGVVTANRIDAAPGAVFNFTAGALNLTGSDLLVGPGGLLGQSLSLGAGQTLSVARVGAAAPLSTLSVDGSGLLEVDAGGKLTVDRLTVSAQGLATLHGGTLTTGSIDVAPGGSFSFAAGTLNLTNSDLVVGPNGPLGASVQLPAGKALHVSGNVAIQSPGEVTVDGASFTTSTLTLEGPDARFTYVSGQVSLTNLSLNAGAQLHLAAAQGLSVPGTTTISGGSILTLDGAEVTTQTLSLVGVGSRVVYNSGVLHAQNLSLADHAQIEIPAGQDLHVPGTTSLKSGANLAFAGGRLVTDTLALSGADTSVDLHASNFELRNLSLAGGANLILSAGDTSHLDGALSVGVGSTLSLGSAGLVVGSGPGVALPGTLLLTAGGSVECSGQIQGTVINSGGDLYSFAIDGTSSIAGDYVQEAGGRFEMFWAGPDYDFSLHVYGDAHLAGTLFVEVFREINYLDKLVILRADGAIDGGFTHVILQGPPPSFPYSLGVENGAYVFTALSDWSRPSIPEPPTFCLATAALGACVFYTRYRVRRASRLPKRMRQP